MTGSKACPKLLLAIFLALFFLSIALADVFDESDGLNSDVFKYLDKEKGDTKSSETVLKRPASMHGYMNPDYLEARGYELDEGDLLVRCCKTRGLVVCPDPMDERLVEILDILRSRDGYHEFVAFSIKESTYNDRLAWI